MTRAKVQQRVEANDIYDEYQTLSIIYKPRENKCEVAGSAALLNNGHDQGENGYVEGAAKSRGK